MNINDFTNIELRNDSFRTSYGLGHNGFEMIYSKVDLPMPLLESWITSFGDRIPTRLEFLKWKRESDKTPIDPHANRMNGTKPTNNSIDTTDTSLNN